jgi:hypothetical protein
MPSLGSRSMLEDEAPMHDTRKFAEAETKRGLEPAGSENSNQVANFTEDLYLRIVRIS